MLDWAHEGDDALVLAPAIQYLSEQTDADIFAFEDIMAQYLYDIDSRKIAQGLYGDTAHISADMFLYQRCVAVVNGNGYYNSILYGGRKLDPDLEFEGILYVPMEAWAKKHHCDTSDYPHAPTPSYESFSNQALWED